MKKSNLTNAMQKIIDKDAGFVKNHRSDQNPQVKEMVIRAQERVELAEAIIWATKGNMSLLSIFCGERIENL